MALAKKGSRIISVDGTRYRWVVSPDSGYCNVVVELAEQAGQRLQVFCVPYSQSTSWTSLLDRAATEHRTIGPAAVARLIRFGLAQGWMPQQRGGLTFFIQDADEIIWPCENQP